MKKFCSRTLMSAVVVFFALFALAAPVVRAEESKEIEQCIQEQKAGGEKAVGEYNALRTKIQTLAQILKDAHDLVERAEAAKERANQDTSVTENEFKEFIATLEKTRQARDSVRAKLADAKEALNRLGNSVIPQLDRKIMLLNIQKSAAEIQEAAGQ